jgi:uncharacterized protein Yka (UPF0111/DUF47 family)
MTKHTIVLIQTHANENSRRWYHYNTVEAAVEGICQHFENQLKAKNPNVKKLSYGLQDIHEWIDQLPDLCALVYSDAIVAFNPQNKEWIKNSILHHLKKTAGN